MAREIRKVGVVGLGAMGAGIAQLCIEAGVETVGREVSAELGERSRDRIAHFLTRKVEKGQLEQDARDVAVGRLSLTTDLADFADCDLVIEAIVEELAPKQELFARARAASAGRHGARDEHLRALGHRDRVGHLDAAARRRHALLQPCAADAARRDRPRASSPPTTPSRRRTRSARQLGKHPIRCYDTPGFVVNRVLIPLLNDCVRVLDEARVTRRGSRRGHEARRRLADGPVRALDLVGIDVHVHASEALYEKTARAAHGAASAARRDAERGPARPQERPRLLPVLGGAGRLPAGGASAPVFGADAGAVEVLV